MGGRGMSLCNLVPSPISPGLGIAPTKCGRGLGEGDTWPPSDLVWRETITPPRDGLSPGSPAAAATKRGHVASGPAAQPKGTPACRALFLGLRNSSGISANICRQWELQYLPSVSLVFSLQFILAFAPSVGGEDKLASYSSTDQGGGKRSPDCPYLGSHLPSGIEFRPLHSIRQLKLLN
jgi:hypothetical protein